MVLQYNTQKYPESFSKSNCGFLSGLNVPVKENIKNKFCRSSLKVSVIVIHIS